MSLSIAEFVFHLLIQAIALAAASALVPPNAGMPPKQMRRRWMAIGAVVGVIGFAGLTFPIAYFAAWDLLFATLAVIRVGLRLCRRRLSLVNGCTGGLVAVALSSFVIIFPAYQLWRDSLWQRRPHCQLRIRNLGLAMQNYASTHAGRFPDLVASDSDGPAHSWRVALLPYFDRDDLRSSYSFAAAWNAPANLPTARSEVELLSCPANYFPTDETGRRSTNYAAMSGAATAFPNQKGMTLDAIYGADGLAQTILIGECSGLNIVWTEPRDIDVAEEKIGINVPGDRPRSSSSILSSYHPGGAHVVLADGRVQFLSERIDPKVLKALTTAAGGEPVADEQQR